MTESSLQRARRCPPSVTFKDGYAEDWAMAVGECFRDALDIGYTIRQIRRFDDNGNPRRKSSPARKKDGTPKLGAIITVPTSVLTEGAPPAYAFGIGDVIHDCRIPPDQTWGETMKRLNVSLQVKGTVGDKLVVAKSSPNEQRTQLVEVERMEVTQDELVCLLRDGCA